MGQSCYFLIHINRVTGQTGVYPASTSSCSGIDSSNNRCIICESIGWTDTNSSASFAGTVLRNRSTTVWLSLTMHLRCYMVDTVGIKPTTRGLQVVVAALGTFAPIFGSPGRIRTSDILINSETLLPTELLGNNLLLGRGCWIRTSDLSIIGRLHYHCANPRYLYLNTLSNHQCGNLGSSYSSCLNNKPFAMSSFHMLTFKFNHFLPTPNPFFGDRLPPYDS